MEQESYVVSARKYRPESWDAVVGQDSVTSTLKNAIATNQMAQAYLFCGPRGVGKTTCARIFAKAINGFETGTIDDFAFNIFELDAASNNAVDDIRTIIDQVRIPPQQGKYKVYIIDEVHMLSAQAFNAFLKTLEEPPPHAIFILATTEKHKILPTILSRCQIFDFNRIGVYDMVEHLSKIAEKEGVTAEKEALHVVAQKADGALRDALSIFDQLVAFCGSNMTYDAVIENLNVLDHDYYFKLCDHFLEESISSSLLTFNDIIKKGFDAHTFVAGLGDHLRNLLVCKDDVTLKLLEVSDGVKNQYSVQSERFTIEHIIKALDIVNRTDIQYKQSKNPRLLVELCLMQICSIQANLGEKKNGKFSLLPIKGGALKMVAKPVVAVPQTDVPEDSPVLVSRPKPLAAPTGVLSGGVQILDKEKVLVNKKMEDHSVAVGEEKSSEELSEEDLAALPSKEVTQEALDNAWKLFADSMNAKDRPSLAATLIAGAPVLDGTNISMTIHNTIQKMEVESSKGEIMEFIRKHLENFHLQLDVNQLQSDPNKTHLYTDKDKYQAMKDKNPEIEKLRIEFDLNLEF